MGAERCIRDRALLAAILSSLALTLSITLPMRKLARAAEIVTRSSDKRDAIPDLSRRRDESGGLSAVLRVLPQGLYSRLRCLIPIRRCRLQDQ